MEGFVDWSPNWRTSNQMMEEADALVAEKGKGLAQPAQVFLWDLVENFLDGTKDEGEAETRLAYHECMAWRRLLQT